MGGSVSWPARDSRPEMATLPWLTATCTGTTEPSEPCREMRTHRPTASVGSSLAAKLVVPRVV